MVFSGENAYKYLQKLAVEIGSRPSGSEAERKAAEWIRSEFLRLGLDAKIEEFDVTSGRVLSKKLEVMEPYIEEVNCEVSPLSGSTGPDGVTGEVIYVDNYDEECLTEAVTGKIILTSGQPVNRDKAVRCLMRYKPLALILIESTWKGLAKNLGSSTQRKKYGNLPTVRVTFEDGLRLLQNNASKVRVVADTEELSVKSQNVIAELRGSTFPEEVVIVGGHYDTVLEVSGAGDNAGGAAITLELARVFRDKGTKRTMRFAAWGCEELGLRGSHAYASKFKEASDAAKKADENAVTELDNVMLCVNLDVHGGLIGTNSSTITGSPDLTAAVKTLSKELGAGFKVNEGLASSDSTSLAGVGIPGVSLSRGTPTNSLIHSRDDDIRWMSPKALQVHGDFVEEFLTRYAARAVAFPFEKAMPEKVKKDIEEHFKRMGRKPP
jgi:Iap family predicted aminopeptidase